MKTSMWRPAAVAATLLGLVLSALAMAPGAAGAAEPGLMLRPGNWDGDIGTYEVPAPLTALKPSRWPGDGWQRLQFSNDHVTAQTLTPPPRQQPRFLALIASQISAAQAGTTPATPAEPPAAGQDEVLFVRFPGTRLREGRIALYRFKNGTPQLVPKLDHRYELVLAGQPFAFTVRSGGQPGDRAGRSDGAHYTLEYGGARYEYTLPEYGWDSRIGAIADLDGDGQPDFLITVAGNNTSSEYLLLSSLARPGRNVPSASLRATGC